MKLNPQRQARASEALNAVVRQAEIARQTPYLDDCQQALNAVWWAVREAKEVLRDLDRETRTEKAA